MTHPNETQESVLGSLSRTHTQNDRTIWKMRDLLEASAIPFATAEYAPRKAIFHQGDTSDDVLHIEDGSVLLAVSRAAVKKRSVVFLGPARSWARRRSWDAPSGGAAPLR